MNEQDKIKTPRIVLVGGVSADSLTTYLEPFDTNGKNRTAPGMTDIVMGGGAGNAAQAISRINHVFPGQPVSIAIITEMGTAVPGQITDKISHEVVAHHLKESNIECVDIARGACAIAFNTVVEHTGGRMIFVENTIAAPRDMKPDADKLVEDGLKGADYVLLGSSKPHISVMAARAAKKLGVTILTDWDSNTWPDDQAASDMCEEILELSDIIMVPSDTVVKGMANKVENPAELFRRLQGRYGARNILMSNGGNNVRALVDSVEHAIAVEKHSGHLYALAAGDHRNAMLLYSLAQGDNMLTAFSKATAFASLKIKHPRFEWINHVHELAKHSAYAANDNRTPADNSPALDSL
ncbi:MAG: carbohydrate kinase family protein [Alphaproteobacteria bacterium]|nr:carbohydrate kinase family protein [Alphaproteobacteria bacterium]